MRANPFVTRLATLYSEIWTLLSASRFCLFFAVSFFVYQSNPVAWGVETGSGLDQLKNRVIFTYGFMEMMFWLWVCSLAFLGEGNADILDLPHSPGGTTGIGFSICGA